MSSILDSFRARLVEHANRLPRGEAEAWLGAHRLLVLYHHPDLKPELAEFLRRQRRAVLASNILKIDSFVRIVRALGPIPVAPLKGIALLDSVYRDDISLRPMGDIDVLVPQDHVEDAIARLRNIGFTESEPSHRLRKVMHHRVVRGARGFVELHTRLGTALIPASDWETLRPVPARVHGVPAHELPRAAELVHLLVHFYKHGPFTCLGWVDEILALCAQTPPAVEGEFVQVATCTRCRGPVAVALELLRSVVGRPLLHSVDTAALSTSPLRRRAHRALFLRHARGQQGDDGTFLFHPPPKRPKLVEEFHTALLADRLTDSVRDLARLALIHFHARYPTRIRSGEL